MKKSFTAIIIISSAVVAVIALTAIKLSKNTTALRDLTKIPPSKWTEEERSRFDIELKQEMDDLDEEIKEIVMSTDDDVPDFFDEIFSVMVKYCAEDETILKDKIIDLINRYDADPDSFAVKGEYVEPKPMTYDTQADLKPGEVKGFYEFMTEAMCGAGSDARVLRERINIKTGL